METNKMKNNDEKDAQRWRYWRSLFDIENTQKRYEKSLEPTYIQCIERAMTPEDLDAAVDAAIKASKFESSK